MEGRTKIHENAARWTRGRRRAILKTRARERPKTAAVNFQAEEEGTKWIV